MNNNDAETAARECYLFIDQAQFIVCFHCCMRRKSGKRGFHVTKLRQIKSVLMGFAVECWKMSGKYSDKDEVACEV